MLFLFFSYFCYLFFFSFPRQQLICPRFRREARGRLSRSGAAPPGLLERSGAGARRCFRTVQAGNEALLVGAALGLSTPGTGPSRLPSPGSLPASASGHGPFPEALR